MDSSNMIRALGIGTLLALALGMAGTADARSGGGTAAITGSVYTVDTTKKNITIRTNVGTSVKLSIGRSTSITRNGASASLNDIALNDAVSGQYKVSRLSATALALSGPAVTTTTGKATAVSPAAGVLTLGSQNLQTNAGTRIARNGQIVALRQLTLRDTLVVHVAAGTSVALDVVSDGPDESEVHGVITGLSGSNVTITPDDGSPAITIVVGTATTIELEDASGTLADLVVGQAIEAEYDPTTLVAFSIDVSSEEEQAEIEGTVAAIDTVAGTVTIAPQNGGSAVTLAVDASTEINVNDQGGSLADIQVGMPIKAEYDSVTLLAAQIEAGGSQD